MIKFQGAAKPANLFCASQKLAGFGNLKFEILKSVKQDFAPYRFAGEIYTAKFSAAQSELKCINTVREERF